ncbi:MAG: hypothetical protein ACRDTK_02650 [Mycobacterium sp.]
MTSALVAVTLVAAGLLLAPASLADPENNLRDAMASARRETPCGSFRSNPVVEQVAQTINRSTDDYLNHAATRVPILDPLEGLKVLGYGGTKAYLLQGAAKSDAAAIKGAILQGYAAIPDCSYTDFGLNMRRNETTGYNLASVVLAGS